MFFDYIKAIRWIWRSWVLEIRVDWLVDLGIACKQGKLSEEILDVFFWARTSYIFCDINNVVGQFLYLQGYDRRVLRGDVDVHKLYPPLLGTAG
jgi:hypothetical protein